MKELFICPKCKSGMNLPKCRLCEFEIPKINNIWQISNMPDKITDGDGDKYIGYEHIGKNYSGDTKHLISKRDKIIAEVIAKTTGDGLFLDLACGDGCFTVPCAKLGTKIIAGDISNAMLNILQERSKQNEVSLENVHLCRINALDLSIVNESIDVVIANSVLHLISNPEKVILELYRVLKPGGVFICLDDKPGKIPNSTFDNSKYNEIVNSLYNEYWMQLKEYNILPKKYSWKFDRKQFCEKLFSEKREMIIKREETIVTSLKDGFLSRFFGRGFSDQTDVPQDIHEKIIKNLISDFKISYGEEYSEILFTESEEDISLVIYKK